MPDVNHLPDETTESFVIRLWQEEPGLWRGRIRHVGSETQRAFTRMSEVPAFIGERLGPAGGAPLSLWSFPRWLEDRGKDWERVRVRARGRQSGGGQSPISHFPTFMPRPLRFAGAVAALLVVGLAVLLLSGPQAATPLAGTAAADAIALDGIVTFLAGMAAGGIGAAVAFRLKGGR